MRIVLIGLVTLAATLADLQSAGAQGSFFSRRYCAQGGGSLSSAMPDCSFNTWEQCRASVSGLGRYCAENPFWKPEGRQDRIPQRRSGRRSDY